jgi:stage II sporulation protein D
MKKSIFYFLLLTFYFSFLSSLSVAEDTIRVLIVENPQVPLLKPDAEKMGSLKGDVFINGHVYSGLFDVRRDENGLHFINILPLEKYIEGVVAAETGEDWAIEALKAQAVISRTYAIYQKNLNAGKDYHITSSVLHQVYKGDIADQRIKRAVKETEGEIVTYEGKPIKAIYHSSCKGKTELPEVVWGEEYPYLRSVLCMDNASPYEHWTRRYTFEEMEEMLGINGIRDIRITSFTSTGRVKMLKVFAEASELDIRAVDLRRLLGYKELPSTQFTLTISGRDIIFEGSGYGHGVGLSQWGALEMARQGWSYREILEHYYPGTILKKVTHNEL